MKRLSWKYIAGFVDGEGCLDIQASRNRYITPRLRIALAEQGKPVLDMLANSHGGSLHERKHNNPDWATAWSWEITGYKRICPLLRNIVNHLVIKKEQARFILWCETHLKGMNYGRNVDPELVGRVRKFAQEELKAMKRDPHRLSEKAQDSVLGMLQSS